MLARWSARIGVYIFTFYMVQPAGWAGRRTCGLETSHCIQHVDKAHNAAASKSKI